MKQDFIRIHIQTDEPVELSDLTEALAAFNRSYALFAKQAGEKSSSLLVKEVNKGSIIFDLISKIATLVPAITEFIPRIKKAWNALMDDDTDNMTMKDLRQVEGVAGLIRMGDNCRVSITTYNNGGEVNRFEMDNESGRKCLERIESKITPDSGEVVRKSQLLYFTQMSRLGNKGGTKGVIDAVCPRPINVLFFGDTKEKFFESSENPFLKAHIVDVVVQTVNGNPANYKVTAYYGAIDVD